MVGEEPGRALQQRGPPVLRGGQLLGRHRAPVRDVAPHHRPDGVAGPLDGVADRRRHVPAAQDAERLVGAAHRRRRLGHDQAELLDPRPRPVVRREHRRLVRQAEVAAPGRAHARQVALERRRSRPAAARWRTGRAGRVPTPPRAAGARRPRGAPSGRPPTGRTTRRATARSAPGPAWAAVRRRCRSWPGCAASRPCRCRRPPRPCRSRARRRRHRCCRPGCGSGRRGCG